MSTVHQLRSFFAPTFTRKRPEKRLFSRLDLAMACFLGLLLLIAFVTTLVWHPASPATLGPGLGGAATSQTAATGAVAMDAPDHKVADDPVTQILNGTNLDYTVNNSGIATIWKDVVLIADAAITCIIAVIGFRIMAGGIGLRYAEAVESIPKVVLAAIGANISLYWITFLLQLNNALCSGMVAAAQDAFNKQYPFYSIQDLIIAMILQLIAPVAGPVIKMLCAVVDWIPGVSCPSFTDAIPGGLGPLGIIGTILQLIIAFFILLVLIQSIARLAVLNLMIILSPIGMICWSLPQGMGQGMFRLWMNGLTSAVFVQFLQLTTYATGLALFNVLPQSITANATFSLIFNITPSDLIRIVMIWLVLKVPGWLQNAVVGTMGQASHTVVASVNQMIMAVQQGISTAIMLGAR